MSSDKMPKLVTRGGAVGSASAGAEKKPTVNYKDMSFADRRARDKFYTSTNINNVRGQFVKNEEEAKKLSTVRRYRQNYRDTTKSNRARDKVAYAMEVGRLVNEGVLEEGNARIGNKELIQERELQRLAAQDPMALLESNEFMVDAMPEEGREGEEGSGGSDDEASYGSGGYDDSAVDLLDPLAALGGLDDDGTGLMLGSPVASEESETVDATPLALSLVSGQSGSGQPTIVVRRRGGGSPQVGGKRERGDE